MNISVFFPHVVLLPQTYMGFNFLMFYSEKRKYDEGP